MTNNRMLAKQRAIAETVEAILKYSGPFSNASARTAEEMVLRPMVLAGLRLADIPTQVEPGGCYMRTHEGLEELCQKVINEERVPISMDVLNYAHTILAERRGHEASMALARGAAKLDRLAPAHPQSGFANLAAMIRRGLSMRASRP